MKKTLREIAEIVGGEIVGNPDVVITGVCGIKEANEGDITFVANSKYVSLMRQTRASAIITSRDIREASKPIIKTENPSLAFAKMVELLSPNEVYYPKGIHSTAIMGKNVTLGKNVAVHAYSVIEDNASIGDDTIIYPLVYIGHSTKIGSGSLIYSHVSIREKVTIGNRVIVHSGTVIGSDGFGFATVKGMHHKIPQIGTVIIEDDVEIGSNVTIDRARFGRTLISKGTKIDNLVQIAHNVEIGENSIIVAQTGISGSTSIGKGVTLAGQSGIVGHISIGDNSVVAAKAGVTINIPSNSCVSGYPAKPHLVAKRINACIQRLPKLFEAVSEIRGKIDALTKAVFKEEEVGTTKNNKERS
ncbi:MAG: UDP-3-O-(3-hydroxymyristoyl)glucosamine N-acyltransferase [Candidatus Omnitrophica bacterium]|nr:UDP-3-O-(3-hydroxymyristoyl)glucosamine N-acyltransferase [Candidatus Omnitrophota bacterium]